MHVTAEALDASSASAEHSVPRRRRFAGRPVVTIVRRRITGSLVTLFVAAVAVFLLMRSVPGDSARVIAGFGADPAEIERVRHSLHLDRSLPVQLRLYFADLLTGDLGTSTQSGRTVRAEILSRFPNTVELASGAMAAGLVIGVPLGVVSAWKRRTWVDATLTVLTLVGMSIPVYVLALLLISVFAVTLGIFPVAGSAGWQSLVLPVACLAVWCVAVTTRITRSAVLETLQQDYVRTATAKGLAPGAMLRRYALRNALVPILTVAGLQFGMLLGGTVLIESIFAWPGIGRLLIDGVQARDIPLVQGIVLTYTFAFVVVNAVVDVAYVCIDPRISS